MTPTPRPDAPDSPARASSTAEPGRPVDEEALDTLRLAHATALLRERRHPRAVQVANGVLRKALLSSRRSLPIHGQGAYDFVRVNDQVLIGRLRHEIDVASPTFAVGRIYLRVGPDAQLKEITIELFVQYGEVLLGAADHVREITLETLEQTLGAGAVTVAVTPTHVHISDITVGNPHLVDPSDEHPR